MTQENVILRCESCGVKNRVPVSRIKDKPICGRCGARMKAVDFHNKPVDVTDSSFQQEVLFHTGPVVLDCWAPWCGPCQSIAPVLGQLAAQYAGQVKIAKLNVDQNPQTASRFQVMSIPTMLFFKNGQMVNSAVGALPKHEIERHIRSLLN